jgi:hypothetical protein
MILLPDPQDDKQSNEEEEYMASLGIEILRYPLDDVNDHHPSASPHHLLDDILERASLMRRGQPDPFSQKGGLPS